MSVMPESRPAIDSGTGSQPVDPIDSRARRWVTVLAATLAYVGH
jgi:hypothetical protein